MVVAISILRHLLLISAVCTLCVSLKKSCKLARRYDAVINAICGISCAIFFINPKYPILTLLSSILFVFGTSSLAYSFVKYKNVIKYTVPYVSLLFENVIMISVITNFSQFIHLLFIIHYVIIIIFILCWCINLEIERTIYTPIGIVLFILQIACSFLTLDIGYVIQYFLNTCIVLLCLVRQLSCIYGLSKKRKRKSFIYKFYI